MRNKPVRQAFIYTFIITACVMVTALMFVTVDQVTGQTLHGEAYRPPLFSLDIDAVLHWLPPRIQGLLQLPEAIQQWLQQLINKAP